MTKLTIVVLPAFDYRGKRRHDRFDARLQSGDEVICQAAQRLLDGSFKLRRRGADPTASICVVHAAIFIAAENVMRFVDAICDAVGIGPIGGPSGGCE
jgi:hypothetical protein